MKKRLTALLLALVMALALTACGGGDAPAEDEAAEAPSEEAEATAEPTAEPTPTPVPTPEPTPEPGYRLAKAVVNAINEYTFAYDQGGYLPTEILVNGQSYATAAYDEEGRPLSWESSAESVTRSYDEHGGITEETWSYHSDSYVGTDHNVYQRTYDDAGRCIRAEGTTDYGDGDMSTSITEYTYDEAGNCIREESTCEYSDGDGYAEIYEYAYDDAGALVRREYTMDFGDGDVSTNTRLYADGEDGHSRVVTLENGALFSVEYEVPPLDGAWISGGSGGISRFRLRDDDVWSDEIVTIYIRDSDEPPVPTYDDNGFLTCLDIGENEYHIEFTYEPVA